MAKYETLITEDNSVIIKKNGHQVYFRPKFRTRAQAEAIAKEKLDELQGIQKPAGDITLEVQNAYSDFVHKIVE